MRIFSFIPALVAFITAVAGAPCPGPPVVAGCGFEGGCEVANLATKRNFFEHPVRTVHGLTNVELLRRGLPLKHPIMKQLRTNRADRDRLVQTP